MSIDGGESLARVLRAPLEASVQCTVVKPSSDHRWAQATGDPPTGHCNYDDNRPAAFGDTRPHFPRGKGPQLLRERCRESPFKGQAPSQAPSQAALTASGILGALARATGVTADVAGEYRGWYPLKEPERDRPSGDWLPDRSMYLGRRTSGLHYGIDIFALPGMELVACVAGTLEWHEQKTDKGELTGLGHYARITVSGVDGASYSVSYGHLRAPAKRRNGEIHVGDFVGQVGCSGNANDRLCEHPDRFGAQSSHVHIQVKSLASGYYVDPVHFLGWTVRTAPRPES